MQYPGTVWVTIGVLFVAGVLIFLVSGGPAGPQIDVRSVLIGWILTGAAFVWFALQMVVAFIRTSRRGK